jgi:Peptidase family C25
MNLLLITSGIGLASVYGTDGANQVQEKLAQTAQTLNGVGRILASSAFSGSIPSAPPDAPTLYAELKTFVSQQRAAIDPGSFCLLIVGDQRIVPSFQVANPVTDRSVDPDFTVFTDNPYGQFDWLLPEQCVQPPFAVGRLAAGVGDSATALCALLDSLVALHQQPKSRTGYVEITSRQWQDSSASVLSLQASPAQVIVSPDGRVSASNASVLDCKFLYCNLHGFLNDSAWRGYDQGLSYPVPAVTPDAFLAQFVSGTVVFTEACYGLATSGKKTSSSNALSLQAAGAAAVIGSTGLAYGTATVKPQDLIDADVLARTFFNTAAVTGATPGRCLLQARSALRASDSSSNPFVIKTLLEFQLLGDPSYAIH